MNALKTLLLLTLLIGSIAVCASAEQLIVDILRSGDTAKIVTDNKEYELQLMIVSDVVQKAMFSLNGERSRALRSREKYTFSDGSVIIVSSVLPKTHGGSMVEYYFIPSDRQVAQTDKVSASVIYPLPDLEYDLGGLSEDYTTPVQKVLQPVVEQKPIPKPEPAKDECSKDEDCIDHDGCTADSCTGAPKRCKNQKSTPGCSFGIHYCVPYFRTVRMSNESGMYCGLDNKWMDQVPDGAQCTGDYECLSGYCENNKCAQQAMPIEEKPAVQAAQPQPEPNWWDKITNFIRGLFAK